MRYRGRLDGPFSSVKKLPESCIATTIIDGNEKSGKKKKKPPELLSGHVCRSFENGSVSGRDRVVATVFLDGTTHLESQGEQGCDEQDGGAQDDGPHRWCVTAA